jgi:hypothetical protein
MACSTNYRKDYATPHRLRRGLFAMLRSHSALVTSTLSSIGSVPVVNAKSSDVAAPAEISTVVAWGRCYPATPSVTLYWPGYWPGASRDARQRLSAVRVGDDRRRDRRAVRFGANQNTFRFPYSAEETTLLTAASSVCAAPFTGANVVRPSAEEVSPPAAAAGAFARGASALSARGPYRQNAHQVIRTPKGSLSCRESPDAKHGNCSISGEANERDSSQ